MIPTHRLTLAVCLLASSCPALASQVLLVTKTQKLIAVSHEPDREWGLNDEICVYQDAREVACGRVVKVRDKAAIVRLDQKEASIAKGDSVRSRIMESNEKRENEFFLRSDVDPYEWFNLRNASIGMNWLSATFHLQQAIASNFSVGLEPVYILNQNAGNGKLEGMGILLTMNFYEDYMYNGFWAQAGGGWYFINGILGDAREEVRSVVFSLTAGWRWRFANNLNAGVAFGAQYLLKSPAEFDLGFSGFLPSAVVDFGFVF